MPCEMPMAICMGIMLILWEMPMAATGLVPKAAVKLFKTVMPVTFKRF